jgi:peptide/nickel transport system substrate-binding protein
MHRGQILGRRPLLAGAAALAAPRKALAEAALRFGLSAFPTNLRPWENLGTAAETVKLQSFRGLLSYGPDGVIRPEVAASYQAESATSFAFTLRGDAKFHNGSPVTAEDVAFSLRAIADPKIPAYLKDAFGAIAGIEILAPDRLRIRLSSPNSAFVVLLASYDAPIVCRAAYEADPSQPVGCGPYVLQSAERGRSLDFVAFPGYYRPGLPRTQALKFIVYADETLRVAALQAGDVDLIEYVPAQSMAAIAANPDLFLDSVDGPASIVMFNVSRGPFMDKRIRQAVGYAINRTDVVRAAFAGFGSPLGGIPVSPKSEFFNAAEANHWTYDPAKAKQLLAQAGVAEGFNTNLLATSQYSVHRDVAIVVQQHLAQVGIRAELNLPDWPTRVALGNRGQYEISVTATSLDANDPDELNMLLRGGMAPSFARPFGYNNDEVNRLLDAGRAEADPQRRRAAYAKLQEVAVEDPGIIGVNWRAQAYAGRKSVSGFANMPGFLTFSSGLTLENCSVA